MGVDILKLLQQSEPAAPGREIPVHTGEGPSRYGEVALQREAEAVAHAPTGRRNDILNRASFNCAQLIATGHIDADRVHATLSNAAVVCGLGETETQATLRSGYRAGIKQPRAVPPWEAPQVPEATVLRLRPREGADGDETGADGEPAPEGAGEADEAAQRREALAAWVAEHLPALDWRTLWDDDTEDEWILEPLIPARRLVALYSAPKVGKSLLCLEVAAAVSAGREVLGVAPERRWRVLYVDFENDPRGDIRPRLQAMGYAPADLDHLHYLSFPTIAALDSEAGSIQLLAAVEHYGTELVVIDTLSRAVAGEENDNDTWLSFYRHTGLRLKQAEVACVRLDHAGKDAEKGQRGGSAKSGDVDAVWRMTGLADDTFALTCEANRLPVATKRLTFERRALPHLHSFVDKAVQLPALHRKADQLIDLMDDAGLPADAGRGQLDTLLQTTGITAEKAARQLAVKRRKGRPKTTVLSARFSTGQVPARELGGQDRAGGPE